MLHYSRRRRFYPALGARLQAPLLKQNIDDHRREAIPVVVVVRVDDAGPKEAIQAGEMESLRVGLEEAGGTAATASG